MSKHIQAYFKSEDDAEGARSSLLPLGLEQLEVGHLDQAMGRTSNLQVPLSPANTGSMATGNVVATGGYSGSTPSLGIIPIVSSNVADGEVERPDEALDAVVGFENIGDVDSDLQYVLNAKVKDSEYDDVVQKLRSQGAYVAQLNE
ncbi:hypothetical protein EJP82_20400 [Paenibacillus anaericanus]|uniref:Uncharacterized protein n=1 Tax=Paenibacillus anaericanus TaxID=170367 RepID=A0A433Y4Y9_9BACL|nr:hypothetical protein [Paenibacillus anaericanus]RUT43316.1 hypothetical protein EJP82_20400 [Paenibacillus anaericanus]